MKTTKHLALALLLAAAGCVEAGETETGSAAADAGADTMAAAERVEVGEDAGLQTPESVLHDAQADVYLVSNINGTPFEKDGNGFIARVRPDGTVENLKWIDGAAEGVRLNAPKGLALKGDTLFVSDIDSVRAFHRTSGQPLGARGVPTASFLNDLAVGPDGTLYVSDTGLDPSFQPSGNNAVYRFRDGQAIAVAEGAHMAGPNGIAVAEGAVLVAPFGSAAIMSYPIAGGSPDTVATLPGGQLDGLVRQDDGTLLVSSWEASAVFRVPQGGGPPETVVENIPSPADIGWDAQRQRVLIPVFQENRLVFAPVQPAPAAPAQ